MKVPYARTWEKEAEALRVTPILPACINVHQLSDRGHDAIGRISTYFSI